MQVLPLQQPLTQVLELHTGTQDPSEQVSALEHELLDAL